MKELLEKRVPAAVNLGLMLFVYAFILSYLKPRFLFLQTTTTGGDTSSQFYAAWFMRHVLLPQWRVTGWCPGNFAGFPIFEFYFPIPFLVISALSFLIPLTVAFKLVSVLGIFLLPLCVFLLFTLLESPFPGPVIASSLTLPFLFMEANSMWGGNIPSTLAGEYAYGIAFALSLMFMGTLYSGLRQNKNLAGNALLLAVIGLCHACGLIFSGLMGFFFLRQAKDFNKRLFYLLKLYLISFLLMGFWLIPGLVRTRYVTAFNFIWTINSLLEIFPKVLLPFIGLSLIFGIGKLVFGLRGEKGTSPQDPPSLYLWYGAFMAGLLYFVGPMLNVADIRFLPYVQLLLVILSGWYFAGFIQRLRGIAILACVAALGTFLWVDRNVTYIHDWIAWNYSGFESKPAWPMFQKINKTLSGSSGDPRVAYESSPEHNVFGSMRAFEDLPFFSGRSTLEGLYLQSSVSAPFVFLIESETSAQPPDPLPNYFYPEFNMRNGIEHLKMFNVDQLIIRNDKTKEVAGKTPGLTLKEQIGLYQIYRLNGSDGAYVVPVQNQPVVYEGKDWREISYQWFRRMDLLDVPVLFTEGAKSADARLAGLPRISAVGDIKHVPLAGKPIVHSRLSNDVLEIDTDEIGHPLWIRISFHPNWKIEGADKVYFASPSFMLIYPTSAHVRLYFGRTWSDYVGLIFTILGLIGLMVLFMDKKIGWLEESGLPRLEIPQLYLNAVWISILLLLAVGAVAFNLTQPDRDYNRAINLYNAKKFEIAGKNFERLSRKYAKTPIAERSLYFAAICDINTRNISSEMEHWNRLLSDFWDSPHVPEAYYCLAQDYRQLNQADRARTLEGKVLSEFPGSYWAKALKERKPQ